jgi:oligopeptide/dipeptide ABC transporter ATP-binding protein
MYGGQFVETGATADVLARPRHPYTSALLDSLPPEIGSQAPPRQPLRAIPGGVVNLRAPPQGCRFAERCALRIDACEAAPVPLRVLDDGAVRCIRAGAA